MAVSIPKEGREVESRSDWATPKAVYDLINLRFGPFTLDPCASHENAKCERFFTKEQNGLEQSWAGETCYVNPPYGKELPKWTAKAIEEMQTNRVTSVFLIPPRVGTPWFQDFCEKAKCVFFLRGRVAFVDPAGKRTSPMDDNCVVVLEPGKPYWEHPTMGFWDWKSELK